MLDLAKLPFRKAVPVCTAMSTIWMSRGLFLLHYATSQMPDARCLLPAGSRDRWKGSTNVTWMPGHARTDRGTSVSKKEFRVSKFLWHWLHLTGLPFSSYFLQVPELFVLFYPEFPEILDLGLFPGGRPRNWMPAPHVEKEKAAAFTCCLLPTCWVWHWPAGWWSLIHSQDWYIKQAGNDKMQAGSNLIISLTAPSGLVISAPQQKLRHVP